MTRKIALLHSGKKDMFTDPVNILKSALPGDVELTENYAEDDIGKLEDDADELVAAGDILVIVAAGGPQSAIAAMNATSIQPDLTGKKTCRLHDSLRSRAHRPRRQYLHTWQKLDRNGRANLRA